MTDPVCRPIPVGRLWKVILTIVDIPGRRETYLTKEEIIKIITPVAQVAGTDIEVRSCELAFPMPSINKVNNIKEK